MLCGGTRRVVVVASVTGKGRAMSGRKVAPAVFAGVLVAVCAGCSGGDEAAPSSTAASTSTTAVVWTAPTPTIAATVPSTTPRTTSPPTTTPGTDAATSTATVPTRQQAKRDVIAAAMASWTAFNELLLDPTNDETLKAVTTTFTGDALDRAIEIAAKLRQEGRKSVTNRELPAAITPYPKTVLLDLQEGSAHIDYCRLGSNVAVEAGGNDDGTDRVINDEINSYRERDAFVLVDGAWLKTDGETIEIFEGETSCAG